MRANSTPKNVPHESPSTKATTIRASVHGVNIARMRRRFWEAARTAGSMAERKVPLCRNGTEAFPAACAASTASGGASLVTVLSNDGRGGGEVRAGAFTEGRSVMSMAGAEGGATRGASMEAMSSPTGTPDRGVTARRSASSIASVLAKRRFRCGAKATAKKSTNARASGGNVSDGACC